MRIATYNLWNSEQGMPERSRHLLLEIRKADADILCLQEVADQATADQKRLRPDSVREDEGVLRFSRKGNRKPDSASEC